ncbi:hypothetical protein [Microbacterium sp. Root180]|uniref:hypothetical protein n=1 Tax=Microbacterium sp. Root180 TaxID=1736483 RepID=UPI000A47331C|nr:hypothetical protein [Microbacterium sp. Root180]
MAAAVRRNAFIPILAIVVGVVGALAYVVTEPRLTTVAAESLVTIAAEPGAAAIDEAARTIAAAQLAAGVAATTTTARVLQPVIDTLGIDGSTADLAGRVEVTSSPGSAVIRVAVTDEDSRAAESIADAVSAALAETVEARHPLARVEIIEPAGAREPRVTPQIGQALVTGFLAGTGLGTVVLWARIAFSSRIQLPSDAVAASGARLLGFVRAGRHRADDTRATVRMLDVVAARQPANQDVVLATLVDDVAPALAVAKLARLSGAEPKIVEGLPQTSTATIEQFADKDIAVVAVAGRTRKAAVSETTDLATAAGGRVIGTIVFTAARGRAEVSP